MVLLSRAAGTRLKGIILVLIAVQSSFAQGGQLTAPFAQVDSRSVSLAVSGAFSSFETYGWAWRHGVPLDENLMALALAIRMNCHKVAGYTSGTCSAVLCRPLRSSAQTSQSIEVLGFGINAPPRFLPARIGMRTASNSTLGVRMRNGSHNEIHAEMQVLARCARHGIATKDCWLYVALPPCWECCKALVAAGISRVIFRRYCARERAASKDPGRRERYHAQASGVEWTQFDDTPELEAYMQELWETWKQAHSLDRAAIKAQASYRPF